MSKHREAHVRPLLSQLTFNRVLALATLLGTAVGLAVAVAAWRFPVEQPEPTQNTTVHIIIEVPQPQLAPCRHKRHE